MLRALLLSIRQLGDPAFQRVLLKSLGLTLLAFIVIGAVLAALVMGLFYWFGWLDMDGGDALTAVALTVFFVLLAITVLFRAVATAIIGLFADEIVDAVEQEHYPDKAAVALRSPLREQLAVGLASIGRAVGWNLLALPIYLLLFLTGIGTIIAVYLVNALLLGRDLGDMIAVRHVPKADRRDWMRATRGKRMRAGLVGTGLFVIPFVNLLAPILSAAMAAHLLHGGPENAT
jgi:uncharacterized protein involved in cysteine biosynthesis